MARILKHTQSKHGERQAPPQDASGDSDSGGNNESADQVARRIDQQIAGRIRERRRLLGMTQQRLAAIVGVAFQQVHKYEHGQSRISAGRLYLVAKALKAPIGYFFAANGELKSEKPPPEENGAEKPEPVAAQPRRSSPMRFFHERRGSVAVMVAIMAPVLILFAGLGAEVGMWYSIKRQNQSAADEAAISAAIESQEGYTCQSAVIPPAPSDDVAAVTAAAAKYNGFDSASPNSLTITCPYTDSYIKSLNPPVSNAVEVITAQKLNTLFASFALPFVTIRNRAVAAIVPSKEACSLLALDGGPVGSPYYFGPASAINQADSIYVAGGNNLTAPGICSNSNDATSIFFQGGATGGNTSYITDLITMGNWAEDNNYNAVISSPEPYNTPAYADPYAGKVSYTAPTTSPVVLNCTTTPCTQPPSISAGGTVNNVAYCPMYFSNSQSVVLQPGVYIIEGENNQAPQAALTTKNGATLSVVNNGPITFIFTSVPTGLSFANCGNGNGSYGGSVDLQGGAVTLQAPTTAIGGIPSGLLFYQDPTTADTSCVHSNLQTSNCNIISAPTSGWSLTGVSDTPATTMSFSGNANSQCFLVYALAIFFNGGTGSTFSGTPAGCENSGASYIGIPTVSLLE